MGDFDEQMRRIASLIEEIERDANHNVRDAMHQLMQSDLDLHRGGLERMLEIVRSSDAGPALLPLLAGDTQMASVLLVHGLHPVSFESRVAQAIDGLRSTVRSHGYAIDRVDTTPDQGIRLTLSPMGRRAARFSSSVMVQTIEMAMYETAPDFTSLAIDGLIEDAPAPPPQPQVAFVPMSAVRGRSRSPEIA
jgi:hypothetical protein